MCISMGRNPANTLQSKIFTDFAGWSAATKNFKFITDAKSGWKLHHENFIHENLFFLTDFGKATKYFIPQKF